MNQYSIGATFSWSHVGFHSKGLKGCTEDVNLSVLESFFPRSGAYLPLSGRCVCKVILCQVKDAKSPVQCQHMHSSLPLLHPKISQSNTESPLVLKTQEANCDPIHCFG